MNKKWIIFSSLALITIFIVYFAKLNTLTNEHQKSLEDLQQKINKVQQENNNLKQKVNTTQKNVENTLPTHTGVNVEITDIKIQSNDMYTEGDLKGYIYGGFKVVAKIKNLSNFSYDNLKVASIFVTSIPQYEKNIKSESKAKTILNFKQNEEREIVFEGFQVDHPETIQEVIVSVMDNRNEMSDVKKIKVKAAFSPQSQD